MRIGIKPASVEHKPQLKNLLSDYLLELSQYDDVDLNYRYFDAYWQEVASRWPYLIQQDGQTIGFALVNTWSPSGRGTDFAMAEFYITPDARGRGAGGRAARAVLNAHPGIWELNIMPLNEPAQNFWPRVIDAAGATKIERFEANGETIYRFTVGTG